MKTFEQNLTRQSLEFDWLSNLSADIQRLVLDAMTEKTYTSGTVLYAQGDQPNRAFQIRTGQVLIYTLAKNGRRFLLKIYSPGEWPGIISLIEGGEHLVFAETKGLTRIGILTKSVLDKLRHDYPEIERALTQQLARALRRTLSLLETATMMPVEARVASRLLWLAKGAEISGDGCIHLTFAQEDLGAMVGASRQTVNRILAQMQEAGLVELSYGGLTLRDIDGLTRLLHPL